MTDAATADANVLDECYQRNLTLRADRNQLDHSLLAVFANAVDVLLYRGLAYMVGVSEGRKPLELTCDLRRPIRRLERMADLAEAYGEWSHEELESAAFLAASRQAVRMQTFAASVESEARLLATLGASGAFARCLLEWRKLRAVGDLPSPEFVAYCIAADWGQVIHKHSLPEVACHLAAAFEDSQLTVTQAEKLVAENGMRLLTPELARELAEEAISRAQISRAGASVEPASPDGSG